MIISYEGKNERELVEICQKYRHISSFHELFCVIYGNKDIHREFSNIFYNVITKLEVVPNLRYTLRKIGYKEEAVAAIVNGVINSIYSDFRALFFEKGDNKENYTLQNCLREIGCNSEANNIDNILREELSLTGRSFKETIKTITDKSVAHFDGKISSNDLLLIRDKYKYVLESESRIGFLRVMASAHSIYQKVVIEKVCEKYPDLKEVGDLLEKDRSFFVENFNLTGDLK